jgi:hypothetical protein
MCRKRARETYRPEVRCAWPTANRIDAIATTTGVKAYTSLGATLYTVKHDKWLGVRSRAGGGCSTSLREHPPRPRTIGNSRKRTRLNMTAYVHSCYHSSVSLVLDLQRKLTIERAVDELSTYETFWLHVVRFACVQNLRRTLTSPR